MKRLPFALLGLVVGYVVAALLGYVLVGALSSNTHDRALEAVMTAAFVLGPLGGVAGFIAGWMRGGRERRPHRSGA